MKKSTGPKPLSSLFEKYKQTLQAPEASVVKAASEVISDILDIDVSEKKIKYTPSSRTLSITGGGPLKTEILLHKKDILNHMKGRLGEKNAPKTLL